jgi:hypothetical protein
MAKALSKRETRAVLITACAQIAGIVGIHFVKPTNPAVWFFVWTALLWTLLLGWLQRDSSVESIRKPRNRWGSGRE